MSGYSIGMRAARGRIGSIEDEPPEVTDHLFVISEDVKHDHHSVHRCRQLLAEYLRGCGEVTVVHELTDGYSDQYAILPMSRSQ